MGKKLKETRRYNSRARNQGEVTVDQTEANKIQVDLVNVDPSKYDEANPLVLPSKKRTTTLKKKTGSKKEKFLSKKQRKKLEKIVERREKKSNRAELVSELQNYQLSAETYNALTPLVKVQTEGVRTLLMESKEVVLENKKTIPSRSGWKKSGAIVANKQKFLSWSRRFTNTGGGTNSSQVLGFDTDDEQSLESEASENEEVDEVSDADETTASLDDEETSIEEKETGKEAEETEKLPEPPNENQKAVEEERKRKFEKQLGNSRAAKILKKARSKVLENKKLQAEEKAEKEVKMHRKVIHVTRTEEIVASRSKLPIIPEEQIVMEQITENIYVVLAGETGCGKTTQVPQFLYEAGYAEEGKIIGVTEPRRVAAISMAARVGKELSLTSEEVSYQIRFEGTASSKTKIKFMTDGVLLKEMGHDFLLKKYSVICIDEAHERSLFTDILIGLLSRCVVARNKRNDPLKLVIMSATMRISDFLDNKVLFKTKPGFVHIPARQFPVQIHFSKVTPSNYVEAAVKKVIQIHKKLPPGGILVFVTGQQEVLSVMKHLRRLCSDSDDTIEISKAGFNENTSWRKRDKKRLKNVNLDEAKRFPDAAERGSDSENSETDEVNIEVDVTNLEPLLVLPLYSMLPIEDQKKVFEPPPAGKRLCVITTNVAETSVTIPSIRYVVDTGKVKDKLWDKVTGVQTFRILWCSKASAEQRAGRAGRIGPGHCYRLFSSAVFEHEFQEYSTPEIKSRPVDDMVLLMKSMAIDQVKNFPYPTPPDDKQLEIAEELLLHLGALVKPSGVRKGQPATISPLGLTMSQLPVGPRFAKMLAMSFNHSLAEYMILLAAAFTVQEVLLETGGDKVLEEKWSTVRRRWTGVGTSALLGDAKVLIKAVEAFEQDGGSPEFCIKMGLRHKAMVEIRKLRKQLTNNINVLVDNRKEIDLNPKLKPPSDEEATLLRQIILSGSPDRVARRLQPEEVSGGEDQNKLKNAYKCGELEDFVYLHHASVLRKTKPSWIVYQEAFEINGKVYVRGIVSIEPEWILLLCPTMCRFDKPLKDPPPYFDPDDGLVKCYVKSTYGKQGWELPVTKIEYPICAEKYSYFAQFLLEGEIFSQFRQWSCSLLALPKTMTKSWAKLQPRTQSLLEKLVSVEVDSKSKLLAQWRTNPKYLLQEYLEWIPEKLHSKVTLSWPPVK